MSAAVDPEQLALTRHPLPAAAVTRRAAGPGRPDGGLGQDPPERPRGDDDPLALDEQRPLGIVKPIGRRPAAVAVDERRRTVGVAGEEAVDLTG